MDSGHCNRFRENEIVPKHLKISMSLLFGIAVMLLIITMVAICLCIQFLILPSVIAIYLLFPALVILVIACFRPFLASLGLYGKTEKSYLIFCRNFMSLFLLIQIGVFIYIWAATFFCPGLRFYSVEHYHEDPVIGKHLNNLQEKFECCGIRNIFDWNKNEKFSCVEGNPDVHRCSVPSSCCINHLNLSSFDCGAGALNHSTFETTRREDVLYTRGCEPHMIDLRYDAIVWLEILLFCGMTYDLFMWRVLICLLGSLKKSNNQRINRSIMANNQNHMHYHVVQQAPPIMENAFELEGREN